MSTFLAVFLGILPSFFWLWLYLKKDIHPEPKKMIVLVFVSGALIAFPAALFEIAFKFLLIKTGFSISPFLFFAIYYLVGVGLVEELLKCFAVERNALHSSAFDEPVDAMIYMITAALGFAAIENILVLLPEINISSIVSLRDAVITISFRFFGATLLHALCSAVVGYYLALGILNPRKRIFLIVFGIVVASILHGIFDILIIYLDNSFNFIFSQIIILLTVLYFFISYAFGKIKRLKDVCQI